MLLCSFFSDLKDFDGIFEKSLNLNQHPIGTIFMIITQRGQLLLSRACFWSGPLIDSHFVLILVSGNDPHIWTAEFIERSLRNDIKTTNCTGKHVQPRLTREDSLLYPPLSLSVFRSDDHLPSLPSFYVYVLPLFCNQFSFALCLRPSFLSL